MKKVIRVRKKQCYVAGPMDYVQFSLKGPKYNKTNSFFVDILEEFLYCQKS